jgi:hypothetical protein
MKKWDSWCWLGKVEPSFKDLLTSPAYAFPSFNKFLASPPMMRLGLLSIKPDLGYIKLFPACYFLRVMPH